MNDNIYFNSDGGSYYGGYYIDSDGVIHGTKYDAYGKSQYIAPRVKTDEEILETLDFKIVEKFVRMKKLKNLNHE